MGEPYWKQNDNESCDFLNRAIFFLTKIGQGKLGKTFPGLMSLDFLYDTCVVGSEFGHKTLGKPCLVSKAEAIQ